MCMRLEIINFTVMKYMKTAYQKNSFLFYINIISYASTCILILSYFGHVCATYEKNQAACKKNRVLGNIMLVIKYSYLTLQKIKLLDSEE